MTVDYFPRSQLVAALMTGWSPAPGHSYARGEYAFVLVNDRAERCAELAQMLAGIIDTPEPIVCPTAKRLLRGRIRIEAGA